MKNTLPIFLIASTIALPISANAACETGQRIRTVIERGTVLELENGSVWQINSLDTSNTVQWRTGAHITVCEGELINTTAKQIAHAARIPGENEAGNADTLNSGNQIESVGSWPWY